MSNTAHRIFAVLAMATLVAVPVVSHSVFGTSPMLQLGLTGLTAVLANLGFVAIRPLADLGFDLNMHKQLAGIGTGVGYLIFGLRAFYGMTHPVIALTCDILIAVLGYAGITIIKSSPQVAEGLAQAVPVPVAPVARTKDGGWISLALMGVIGLIGLVVVFVFAGCGPTSAYVTALKVKGTTSDTLLTAYQAWRVYDGVYQDNIIAGNNDRMVALQQLAAWRDGTQRKVDDAFVVARDAVTAYSKLLGAADAANKKDWGAAISNVEAAVTELLSALAAAGVELPKPSSARQQLVAWRDLPAARVADAMENVLEQLCADPRLEHLPLCIIDDEVFLATHRRRHPYTYAEVR